MCFLRAVKCKNISERFYQIKSIVRGIYVILYTFREVNDVLW